jgi:hypothetical protein
MNDTQFSDIVANYIILIVIRRVLIRLLLMFRLLPINDHDTTNMSTERNFHLQKKVYKICRL